MLTLTLALAVLSQTYTVEPAYTVRRVEVEKVKASKPNAPKAAPATHVVISLDDLAKITTPPMPPALTDADAARIAGLVAAALPKPPVVVCDFEVEPEPTLTLADLAALVTPIEPHDAEHKAKPPVGGFHENGDLPDRIDNMGDRTHPSRSRPPSSPLLTTDGGGAGGGSETRQVRPAASAPPKVDEKAYCPCPTCAVHGRCTCNTVSPCGDPRCLHSRAAGAVNNYGPAWFPYNERWEVLGTLTLPNVINVTHRRSVGYGVKDPTLLYRFPTPPAVHQPVVPTFYGGTGITPFDGTPRLNPGQNPYPFLPRSGHYVRSCGPNGCQMMWVPN